MDLHFLEDYELQVDSANTNKANFINSIRVDDFIYMRNSDNSYIMKISSKTPNNGDVSLTGIALHKNGELEEYTYYAPTTINDVITKGTMSGNDDYLLYESSMSEFNDRLDFIINNISNL